MNLAENLQKYARLAVRSGLNLQKGQTLIINCQTENAYFLNLVAKEAFEAGALDVVPIWRCDDFSRIRYDNADMSQYEAVPKWQSEMLNSYAEGKAAFLNISSANPDVFAGIDPKKPSAWQRAVKRDCKKYHDMLDVDACVWNILAIPTPVWAKKVFPDLDEKVAMEKLWEAVLKAVRVDTQDPIAAWEQHKNTFKEKRDWLNSLDLSALRIQTDRGTDVTLGMIDGYIFEGGGATSTDGIYFFPNMPTEEIFCTPHRLKATGIVKNALPLIYQGNVIDDFSITLKEGKIVEYTAQKGYDVFKQLIETDEGSHYLGEVALVPNKSPISDMGILFYDTLFDENASCHLAIGMGFPACIKGGVDASEGKRIEMGINDSATHVDFMIGTAKTDITGIKKDGSSVAIFKDGNWA